MPVGKILPHTGDNSDSSLTIYGGAALIGFIGLEIYSLKRRKKYVHSIRRLLRLAFRTCGNGVSRIIIVGAKSCYRPCRVGRD